MARQSYIVLLSENKSIGFILFNIITHQINSKIENFVDCVIDTIFPQRPFLHYLGHAKYATHTRAVSKLLFRIENENDDEVIIYDLISRERE